MVTGSFQPTYKLPRSKLRFYSVIKSRVYVWLGAIFVLLIKTLII